MFCSNCGEKSQDGSKFCSSCGTSLVSSGETASRDENLTTLKEYKNHVDNVTCLECGHKGLKGLVQVNYPWFASFWLWGIPLAIAMFGWIMESFPWYAFTVVLVIATVLRVAVAKRELHCPGCDQKIFA